MKAIKNYDDMTADEQAKFDEAYEARLAKGAAGDAKLKDQAGYHDMTQEEKDMYDRMLLAQKQLKSEEII